MDDVAESVKNETMHIIKKNIDIFSKYSLDVGLTNVIEHTIDTGEAKPIAFKPRRIPIGLEEVVNSKVKELEQAGIIRQSNSPWNFPLVIVKKKNEDIRLCVDYRGLNAKTDRPIYPIPASEEIFDAIGEAKYFSTLDLSSGYYQIPVKSDDMKKTAFTTKHGQFEFTRMPFGLCSAPATFQKMMNIILQRENWSKCLIYLDDVLIFGRTIKEHNDRLSLVLQRIKEAGLKLSPEKCCILKTRVHYLGHVIDADGVRTDPDKITAIKQWHIPMCVKELQSFLGLCNYYRRFIKNYAMLSEPLTRMIQKDAKFDWDDDKINAFNRLKEALSSPPVLALPIRDGYYVLDTDASQNSIGAVLSQIQNGSERVVAFASKTLTKSQRKYCITRKELFSIYTFVLKFKHYLFGQKFTVRTDHEALKWFLKWDSPNTSQFCVWKSELEVYDMVIEYRKGKYHVNADALSRLGYCEQCTLKHNEPL